MIDELQKQLSMKNSGVSVKNAKKDVDPLNNNYTNNGSLSENPEQYQELSTQKFSPHKSSGIKEGFASRIDAFIER